MTQSAPERIRRGPVLLGAALALLAIPLTWPLGSMTAWVSLAGGLIVAYGFWVGGYPYFGLLLGSAISVLPVWAGWLVWGF